MTDYELAHGQPHAVDTAAPKRSAGSVPVKPPGVTPAKPSCARPAPPLPWRALYPLLLLAQNCRPPKISPRPPLTLSS